MVSKETGDFKGGQKENKYEAVISEHKSTDYSVSIFAKERDYFPGSH